MSLPVDPGTPISGNWAEELMRLHALPLDDVGIPGELFLSDVGTLLGSARPMPPTLARTASAIDQIRLDQVAPDEGSDQNEGLAGSVYAIAAQLRDSSIIVADVVAEAFERIARSDSEVRAWALLDKMDAERASRALDSELTRANWRGPLHGIPVGVKDIVDVAGVRTGAGSRHWSDLGREHIPTSDAGVVSLLRSAGAVIIGKTTTHEFAFGGTTPPTRNPHGFDRIPGGSSGGSAAAVAAGHVRVAVGTDTLGSVRIPASYCGVVGFVPTPGLLPRTGIAPLAWSLDRVGLITRTVDDLAWSALALGVTAQTPLTRTDSLACLRGLRIGIPSDALTPPVDGAIAEEFEVVLGWLRSAGAEVTSIDISYGFAAVTAGVAIFLAESLDFHRERWTRRRELFGADVQETLGMAEQLTAGDYVRAQRVRKAIRVEMLAKLSRVDVILTPTMPCGAPLVTQASGGSVLIGGEEVSIADAHLRYNATASLAALPAATQPLGKDLAGMPTGLEWVAGPGRDDAILVAMSGYEALSRTYDSLDR